MSIYGFARMDRIDVPTPAVGEFFEFIDIANDHKTRKDSSGAFIDLDAVAGGVSSFEGRTGIVVSASGDYTASEVTNVPSGDIVATNMQAAINELDAEKAPLTHVGSTGVSQHGVASGAVAGFMSPTDKSKLDGVASGATANSADAFLLDRTNHTSTQLAATISDFSSAADARAAIAITAHEAAADPHPVYATDADLAAGLAGKANSVHTHVSTDVTNFDEAVQDTVATALQDSASVDFTYNDGLGQISAAVLPAGVDHNALLNFSSAVHVDHSTVQIATAATSGLSGGGDISATRNLSLNITGLTAQTQRMAVADETAVYDASQAAHRKMSLLDFMAQRNSFQDQLDTNKSDFIENSLGGLTAAGSGTGNSTQSSTYGMNSVERALGISQSDTGTTAAGRRTLTSDVSQLTTSLARLRFAGRVALEALSDGTDTFTVTIGFLSQLGVGDHSAGAYFRYTHSVNGGRWEAVTAGGGGSPVRTAVDTTVAADVLYSVFEVEINEDGTSVTYFINGALVATITTNIPPLSLLANTTFGYGWKIEKTVGTTQRNISGDWYYFEQQRSIAR